MKKKCFGLMLATVLSLGAMSTVSAGWTTGVAFVNIPGGGNEKTNLDRPNLKTTNTNYASFYCTKRTATLGNSARIVNSNQDLRSSWATLSVNGLSKASESGAAKNYYYYARVKSHSIEWGNNNDVTLDFSADDISR